MPEEMAEANIKPAKREGWSWAGFKKWLGSKLVWESLNALSKSPTMKFVAFIPLFGYLIIFNANVLEYVRLGQNLIGIKETDAAVSIRLQMIYFGLCSLALGYVLYSLFGPKEVRHYNSASSYALGDGQGMKDYVLKEIERTLEGTRFREDAKNYKSVHDSPMQTPNADAKGEVNNAILHLYYRYLNERYRVVIVAIWVLYIIGFSFLLYPSLKIFWRVSMILLKQFDVWLGWTWFSRLLVWCGTVCA